MRNTFGSLIRLNCFRKTHKSKTKIVKALVIVLALILLSGMTSGKRVEAHIIVSSYIFPYLVVGSGPTVKNNPTERIFKSRYGRSVVA